MNTVSPYGGGNTDFSTPLSTTPVSVSSSQQDADFLLFCPSEQEATVESEDIMAVHSSKPCMCDCLERYQRDHAVVAELYKVERIADAFELVKVIFEKWPQHITNYDVLIAEIVFKYVEVLRIYRDLDNTDLRLQRPQEEEKSQHTFGEHFQEDGIIQEEEDGNITSDNMFIKNFKKHFQTETATCLAKRCCVSGCCNSGAKDCRGVSGDKCDGHRSLSCSLVQNLLETNTFFAHAFRNDLLFLSAANKSLDESPKRDLHQSASSSLHTMTTFTVGGLLKELNILENSLLDKTVNVSSRPEKLRGNISSNGWELMVGRSSSSNENLLSGDDRQQLELSQPRNNSDNTNGQSTTPEIWKVLTNTQITNPHDSLKIWYRHYVDNTYMLSFRLEGMVEASLLSVLSVLFEVDLFKMWIPHYGFPLKFGLKGCGVTQQMRRIDKVVYFDMDFPWPFANRDACFEVWAVDDFLRNHCIIAKMSMVHSDTYPATQIEPSAEPTVDNKGLLEQPRYRLLNMSIPPPAPGVQRMIVDGALVVTPVTNNSSMIQLLWHENPQMHVPSYMLNFAGKVLCTSAFNKFRAICKEAHGGIHRERRLANRYVYGFIEDRLKELGLAEGPTEPQQEQARNEANRHSVWLTDGVVVEGETEEAPDRGQKGRIAGWFSHWRGMK